MIYRRLRVLGLIVNILETYIHIILWVSGKISPGKKPPPPVRVMGRVRIKLGTELGLGSAGGRGFWVDFFLEPILCVK